MPKGANSSEGGAEKSNQEGHAGLCLPGSTLCATKCFNALEAVVADEGQLSLAVGEAVGQDPLGRHLQKATQRRRHAGAGHAGVSHTGAYQHWTGADTAGGKHRNDAGQSTKSNMRRVLLTADCRKGLPPAADRVKPPRHKGADLELSNCRLLMRSPAPVFCCQFAASASW